MKKRFMRVGKNLKGKMKLMAGNNSGVGIIEVILILVILIAIVLIFKNQITGIINDAFTAISNDSNDIIK